MDLESIVLNEATHIQKEKYHMSSLTWILELSL